MDATIGMLAVLRQQEMLREARQRNRHPETRSGRQQERTLAFRRPISR